MQIIIAMLISAQLHTSMQPVVVPNGQLLGAVECQCGEWYLPISIFDTVCMDDMAE